MGGAKAQREGLQRSMVAVNADWSERIRKEEAVLNGRPQHNYSRSQLWDIWNADRPPREHDAAAAAAAHGASVAVAHADSPQTADSKPLTNFSYKPPSSIKTGEATAITKNKYAELKLQLELERVLRLEKDAELEKLRRLNLLLEKDKLSPAK